MNTCISCKGKGLCGREKCPITSRFYAQVEKVKPAAGYFGPAPSVFVGSFGYPKVSAGPLMIHDSDHPPDWMMRGLSIDEIVSLRSQTIRGTTMDSGYTDSLEGIALSSRPVDIETSFQKPVSFDLRFDGTIAPVGMTGTIKDLDLVGNPSVARVVDRVTSDTDLTATGACQELNTGGIDLYRIIGLMSAGLLGTANNRHLVPTRWAITAVDDTVGKELKKQVFRYPLYEDITVFSAEQYGNAIAIILLPGDWQYEMIEIWAIDSLWSGGKEQVAVDHEGRTKSGYSPITGAYYSARLAVLEYLTGIKRNARVVVVRWISSAYWAPLGTWVIREVTRKAMNSAPLTCSSIPEATGAVSRFLGRETWLRHSTMIQTIKSQKTLADFT